MTADNKSQEVKNCPPSGLSWYGYNYYRCGSALDELH